MDQPNELGADGATPVIVIGEHDWLDPVELMLRGVASWLTIVGIAGVATGTAVLLAPNISLFAFSLILGANLLASGLGMCFFSLRDREDVYHWFGRALLGALTAIAGLVVFVLPATTVTVMAIVVGIVFITVGVGEVALSVILDSVVPGGRLLGLSGLVSIVAGVFAVAWPDATMQVIAVVIGISLLVVGATALGVMIHVRRTLDRWAEGARSARSTRRTGTTLFHQANLFPQVSRSNEVIDLRDGHPQQEVQERSAPAERLTDR